MKECVLLCCGQGSQLPGMGQDFLAAFPEAKQIFECGSDVLGFDLKSLCFDGSPEELAQTEKAQPAIFAASLLAQYALYHHPKTAECVKAAASGGHSLGEYAAMVIAQMLSLSDAFLLIKHRAALMQACTQEHPGGMTAVLGISAAEVETLCEQTLGYVVPVNYNTPSQTVVAGELAALSALEDTLKSAEKPIKFVRLSVSGAFHSKLMAPAAEQLVQTAKSICFAPPVIPFYSNVTGGLLERDSSEMPAYLGEHLVSPVRFTDQVAAMRTSGFHDYLELGPGKVLTGMLKKNDRGIAAHAIETMAALEKFAATAYSEQLD